MTMFFFPERHDAFFFFLALVSWSAGVETLGLPVKAPLEARRGFLFLESFPGLFPLGERLTVRRAWRRLMKSVSLVGLLLFL